MRKLMPIEENGETVGYFFNCPGCKLGHALYVRPHRNIRAAGWEFNGDIEKPTFKPSVLSRYQFSPESGKATQVCHSFVTDGKLIYLSDCTHELAGQTVDMIDRENIN